MATMKGMKKKLSEAAGMYKIKVSKEGKDKILIDLNGDGEADAALIDTMGNGEPDLLALDMTGDHKFNLFLDDTNNNQYPDVIYIDKKGDGNIQLLSIGDESENVYEEKLAKIYSALVSEDTSDEELNAALYELGQAMNELKGKADLK